MSDKLQEIKDRKCKPNWKGLIYFPIIATHVNSETITDNDAIMLLNEGLLNPKCFDVLPEGYEVKKENTDSKEEKKVSKKQK